MKKTKAKRFKDVFGQYIKNPDLEPIILDSEVRLIEINQKSGAARISLAFSDFIDINGIQKAEKIISEALGISAVIDPTYPPNTLNEGCFPTIMALLKRRVAAVNGAFEGASCHIEDERFMVYLTRRPERDTNDKDRQHTQKLIQDTFGRHIGLFSTGLPK